MPASYTVAAAPPRDPYPSASEGMSRSGRERGEGFHLAGEAFAVRLSGVQTRPALCIQPGY
jgi:hypothetical protein